MEGEDNAKSFLFWCRGRERGECESSNLRKKTKFKKHIANLKGENTIVINRGLPSGKKPKFYFPKSLLALCPRPRAYTVQYHCFKYPCIIPSTIVIF